VVLPPLLWYRLLVLANSRSDQCQSFVNQVLYDPILPADAENYNSLVS